MTIYVWVFIAYVGAGHGGGPMVIDNIVTKEQCEILINKVENSYWVRKPQCVLVEKVKM